MAVLMLIFKEQPLEPPALMIARAGRIARARAAGGSRPPSRLAALVFDSLAGRQVVGLRSGQEERHLVYRAGEVVAHVKITPAAGRRVVFSGQVLRDRVAVPCRIGLYRATATRATAAGRTNELGFFALRPVADGSYLVRVLDDEAHIEIGPIDAGPTG
jgi:hypothetical protein